MKAVGYVNGCTECAQNMLNMLILKLLKRNPVTKWLRPNVEKFMVISLQKTVSKPSLVEAVQATLRCAAKECRESDDEKVAKQVSSPGIGRVLLRWRQERRKLLRAAAKEWQVEDLFS
eukprot:s26_g56.t1